MKKYYLRWFFFFLFSFLGYACNTDTENTQIMEAALEYAKNNSDIEVTVEVDEVVDDYARVLATPADPEIADEAIMYLKKNNGKWQGIALGTSFSPEDFQALRIPEKIR